MVRKEPAPLRAEQRPVAHLLPPNNSTNNSFCNSTSLCNTSTYPLNVTSIPNKAIYSYVQQWSLSLEHQVGRNLVGQLAYVGSKGTHLTAVRDLNQLSPLGDGLNPFGPGQPITSGICSSGANLGFFPVTVNQPGSNLIPSAPAVGPKSPGYRNIVVACSGNPGFANNSNGQPLGFSPDSDRPYPGFSNIISVDNIAGSKYNALQATLRQTVGAFTVGLAYTYSHSMDDSSDRSSANFANSLDLRSNRASSDFDQRHILNVNYIYDLPLSSFCRALPTSLETAAIRRMTPSGLPVLRSERGSAAGRSAASPPFRRELPSASSMAAATMAPALPTTPGWATVSESAPMPT